MVAAVSASFSRVASQFNVLYFFSSASFVFIIYRCAYTAQKKAEQDVIVI